MNDPFDIFKIETDIFTSNMAQENNLVQRVAVKVPPFWSDSPEIWFVQVESQFANADITTDNTKFNTVVGAIETKILGHVREAVLHPPTGNKYENLKQAMLKEFADSDYTKLKKLFSELSLGDNKPSFLLNEMRRLGGANVGEDVLKTLWMNQLPVHARAILATSTAPLSELANTADKIIEVTTSTIAPNINQVQTSEPKDRLSQIEKQINQMVSSINLIKKRYGRSRSRSGKTTPPKSTTGNDDEEDICWYHRKFGVSAKNCRNPCKLSTSKN